MSTPHVIRCRAAIGRSAIVGFLTAYMAIAVPVYLIVNGNTDGLLGLVCGGFFWLMMVLVAIFMLSGLRRRLELTDAALVAVNPLDRTVIPWSNIIAVDIRRGQREWNAVLTTTNGDVRLSPLACMRSGGWKPPRSMRRCVDELSAEIARRRTYHAPPPAV